jgi:hypothetical protein
MPCPEQASHYRADLLNRFFRLSGFRAVSCRSDRGRVLKRNPPRLPVESALHCHRGSGDTDSRHPPLEIEDYGRAVIPAFERAFLRLQTPAKSAILRLPFE